jgi:hypothetical protein
LLLHLLLLLLRRSFLLLVLTLNLHLFNREFSTRMAKPRRMAQQLKTFVIRVIDPLIAAHY